MALPLSAGASDQPYAALSGEHVFTRAKRSVSGKTALVLPGLGGLSCTGAQRCSLFHLHTATSEPRNAIQGRGEVL